MTLKRDIGIDILKFFAVFLIINSHADICYPRYSMLATGGAIGDCLFLFASGYTLFWKPTIRFDKWYKRRINRIYPSVIVCALMGALITMSASIPVIFMGGGQFVMFIMLYYILLYVVQRYWVDHVPAVLFGVAAISLVVYVLWFPYKYETSSKGMYGISTLFRWIPYFGFMLMGAWMGMKSKQPDHRVGCRWYDVAGLVLSLTLFYGMQFAAKKYSAVAPYQIATLLPLAGIVVCFYRVCNANVFSKIYGTKCGNVIIRTVAGLCLESYLIQRYLFTDSLNWLFPFNIPIIMAVILLVSYLCRCLARIFSQTFGSEDYDWKKVFALT